MTMSFVLLLGLVIASVFSYLIYPASIWTLNKMRRTRSKKNPVELSANFQPRVSLIVTAHNEASRIAGKMLNCLELEYPSDKLKIILASDASDDSTEDIARSIAGERCQIVRSPQRLGKENAQRLAVAASDCDVCVFSDVATMIDPNGIQLLIAPLAASDVGATSSEDRFVSRDGAVAGEGLYVKFEMWLRRQESEFGSLVGLSGSLFAAKRTVCQNLDIRVPSDFNVALTCALQGSRSLVACGAYGTYTDIKNDKTESTRKVRTILRGITALMTRPQVLNPLRFGWFSYQMLGHKLMRWLTPYFMISTLVVSIAFATDSLFIRALLISQIFFYAVAILPFFMPSLRKLSLVLAPHYFLSANIAILRAWWLYLTGVRMQTWNPSSR